MEMLGVSDCDTTLNRDDTGKPGGVDGEGESDVIDEESDTLDTWKRLRCEGLGIGLDTGDGTGDGRGERNLPEMPLGGERVDSEVGWSGW